MWAGEQPPVHGRLLSEYTKVTSSLLSQNRGLKGKTEPPPRRHPLTTVHPEVSQGASQGFF